MEFIHLLWRKIPTPFFFVYPFLGAVAKMRARVTRDGTFSSKNSTFGYFDETNPPITGKGIQLRSPIPIMVPGCS